MKLYHAFGARCCRVRWLLEEMGIDYELVPVTFEGGRFSAADIMLGYSLQLARMLGQLPAEAKNATAYLDALSQRPAFAKAFAP